MPTKVRLTDKYEVGDESACWPWKGFYNHKGYGRFQVNGHTISAHRAVYESLIGPVPEGLTLDHLCRNRACVNPQHLEPVTNKVNVLRGTGLCATNAKKMNCPRGHPYSGNNLIIKTYHGNSKTKRVGVERMCRECKSIRNRSTPSSKSNAARTARRARLRAEQEKSTPDMETA